MSTKKQKKPKQKTVSLQEFTASLEPSTPTAGQNIIYAPKKQMISSWADEVEEYAELITEKERIVLPSAPRASRGPAYEDSQIPRVPPYKAHLGNISYDIDDEDVFRFFNGLEVGELRLPRDNNNRLRGFGYVEFRNREDLVEALVMNEQMLRGRPLRISLSGITHGEENGRRGPHVDETPADWRAAEKPGLGTPFYAGAAVGGRRDFPNKDFYNNRRPDFGNYEFTRNKSAYDRSPQQQRPGYGSGDFYVGPPRGGRIPQRDFDNHRPPPMRGDYESQGHTHNNGSFYGGSSDRGDYYRSSSRNEDESISTWRRAPPPPPTHHQAPSAKDSHPHPEAPHVEKAAPQQERMKSPNPPAKESPPRERKKLVLQPRTKSTSESEPTTPAAGPSKTSIFGDARPVDTAAREREIEKKLAELNLLDAKKARLLPRPKPEVLPPVDFAPKKLDTSQRFRRDSSSRSHPPPLMAEPSSPPRILAPRRRRSDEIDRDKDTNSEPEDDRDLRYIEFHRSDRKPREGGEWRGGHPRHLSAGAPPRGRSGDGPRMN